MSGDLMGFICARLDEDERLAQAATPGPWVYGRVPGIAAGDWGARARAGLVSAGARLEDTKHIARWDPARVLAETMAKRLLLDLHKHCDRECYILRVMVLPYAQHSGYRQEWAA